MLKRQRNPKNKIIVFNWKMNPDSLKKAKELFKFSKKSLKSNKNVLIIAPPFVFLEELAKLKSKKRMFLASQDAFWLNPPAGKGAFTGEISDSMLKNLGIRYVILGHSERRQYFKETDELIAKKVFAALTNGLRVILCIGEKERKSKKFTERERKFIETQLKKDLKYLNSKSYIINSQLLIAYEPRWAIGTGKFDNPGDAELVIAAIKRFLKNKFGFAFKFLYGGSVNSKVIRSYLNKPDIDGALIGSASLKKSEIREFLK